MAKVTRPSMDGPVELSGDGVVVVVDMQGASSCFVRQTVNDRLVLPPHRIVHMQSPVKSRRTRTRGGRGETTSFWRRTRESASPRRSSPENKLQPDSPHPGPFPFIDPIPFLTRPEHRGAKPWVTGSATMIHPQGEEEENKKLLHALYHKPSVRRACVLLALCKTHSLLDACTHAFGDEPLPSSSSSSSGSGSGSGSGSKKHHFA
ncbi:hypothetical protein LZ31DRAFT_64154 [Colletotrichum somersetense]|nr:hypothetical protein LZ31DRAFT_64154 [Colletotrichum somersetense]